MNSEIFKYKYRKGSDKSNIWLIEFCKIQNSDRLIGEILKILEQANFKSGEVEEIWMNDELLINANSEEGGIIISRDVYDLVYILPKNENNYTIKEVEKELKRSDKFKRVHNKI